MAAKQGSLTLDPPFSAQYDLAQSIDQSTQSNVSTLHSPSGVAPQRPQPSQPALDILATLPTTFRDPQRRLVLTTDDTLGFLTQDLSVARLSNIYGYLWLAGRPTAARPLHRQQMMDRRILKTMQADLHLLWAQNRLFLKPLPIYLLSHAFWATHLCADAELHRSATGFLLSYVWLVVSELDFALACETGLVPSGMSWAWWKGFVAEFLAGLDAEALDAVDVRYHFGELRLDRINLIYRIRFCRSQYFIRGYLTGYNRYVVFFQANFGWLLAVFVYFSIVLSALQVGVAVPPLNEDEAFQRVSYGFVVFSIVIVATVVALVLGLFFVIFSYHSISALTHARKDARNKKQLTQAKVGTVKA